MIQETVNSDRIAKVRDPYSPALRIGDFIYISQQYPLDENGYLVSEDPVEQVRQVFKNISILLNEEGLDIKHILRTTIFITDPSYIDAVNTVFAEIFDEPFPTRSLIGAAFLDHHAKIAADAALIDTRALEVLCSQNCDCNDTSCTVGE